MPEPAIEPPFNSETIWAAWNALPVDDTDPVHTIAAQLHVPPHDVAAVVYPSHIFGDWDETAETVEMSDDAQRIGRLLSKAEDALVRYIETLRSANAALRSGNSVLRSALLDAVELLTPDQRLDLAHRYPAAIVIDEHADDETCPRCGADTDPDWFCAEGYCPDCCLATQTHDDQ
jgi:hypothetical protein